MVSALKLPVLKTRDAGAKGPIPPKIAEQKLARKNELKAKSTLMLAILDEHLLKFHACKDANPYGKQSRIDNSSNTNETVNTTPSVSAVSSKDQASTGSYIDDVMFSFFSNQSNAPQLDNEDLEQINTDDLKELALKWQVAILTMRVKRFIKKTGRKLDLNGKETVGFDRTKVECYNCYRRGHFSRECRAPRNQGNKNRDAPIRNAPAEEELTNFALIAYTSQGSSNSSSSDSETGLGYDGQMNESNLNDIHVNHSEVVNNVFDSRESVGDDNQVNDRFKKDNIVFKSKVSETITNVPKIETGASKTSKHSLEKPKTIKSSAPLIEEWESNSKDENVFKPKEVADNDGKKSTKVLQKENGVQDPAKEGDNNDQEKYLRDQEEALRKKYEQEFERLFGQGKAANTNSTNRLNITSYMRELTFFLGLQVKQRDDRIFIGQDKYMADILKKFDFSSVKTASTQIETKKALLKDEKAKDIDVHLYRSMIRSLMYLIASRPGIMFVVCACARFQVTPKASHLWALKRIFRYLKSQPKLGLWYPKDLPFNLEAFSDIDYARATLDRKSTT
uniref:CCHC-type domain-containing protein n=1 Tax=Tanacetum cinerariifolium TaxID=118510 RepID=A0A6L2J9M1_TANCI|nr:hypothetical protein [Tanacetum cinerariifolium]